MRIIRETTPGISPSSNNLYLRCRQKSGKIEKTGRNGERIKLDRSIYCLPADLKQHYMRSQTGTDAIFDSRRRLFPGQNYGSQKIPFRYRRRAGLVERPETLSGLADFVYSL